MRYRLLTIVALATVALAATAAATAGTMTATATVTGTAGISLSLPSGPSFSATLNGSDQTNPFSPVLGVGDARGTGAGWNLTISATNFSDGAGHSFAPGSVASATSACQTGSTCTTPTNSITYPLTLTGTAAKFFNAALNSGLGLVNVTPTIDVVIPGNAYAGSYTSTFTLAAATGP